MGDAISSILFFLGDGVTTKVPIPGGDFSNGPVAMSDEFSSVDY